MRLSPSRQSELSNAGSATVAVVVPWPGRSTLTPDEEISLRHLVHYLGQYDKFVISAKSTNHRQSGFETLTFPDRYFGNAQAHARLQLAEEFYARFRGYDYILMYHLDALVLSNELAQWCQFGLDYIGAPWLQCEDSPWVTRPRVGNSGFALMRIESVLNVMHSRRYATDPGEYWRKFCQSRSKYQQLANLPRKYLKRFVMFNGVKREMRRWPDRPGGLGKSDYFWSDEAVKYYPQFRVATVEEGLRFAFEVAPRMCFELNNRQLPFGCHAWPRFDRSFWEPHLLKG